MFFCTCLLPSGAVKKLALILLDHSCTCLFKYPSRDHSDCTSRDHSSTRVLPCSHWSKVTLHNSPCFLSSESSEHNSGSGKVTFSAPFGQSRFSEFRLLLSPPGSATLTMALWSSSGDSGSFSWSGSAWGPSESLAPFSWFRLKKCFSWAVFRRFWTFLTFSLNS